jgi:hypothetical protein
MAPFCHTYCAVWFPSALQLLAKEFILCFRRKIFGVGALAAAREESFFFFAIVEPLNTVLTFFQEQTQCQGLDRSVVVWDVVASCL